MTPPPDGSKSVTYLIHKGDLELVEANLDGALRLLDQSGAHLRSASQIIDGDPGGSFQLSYDAARKSMTAILLIQGLRHTSQGGHLAVEQAITAQFPEIVDFGAIRWMRLLRNQTEYPSPNRPTASYEDALQGLEAATLILRAAQNLASEVEPFEGT
jgi:hypothetical protein